MHMDETFLKELHPPFNTPDLCQLENRNQHLLLDCGRVKLNKDIVCSAYTVERMSLFIQRGNLHAIPIRMTGVHRARLGGALYKVTTERMVELDKQKQNRLSFERKKVDVYVPIPCSDGNIQVLSQKVWLYSAIPDQWEEQIEMSLRKYNVSPETPQFTLAKTYTDNESVLNNHFRYSDKRLEDYQEPPKPTYATQAVVDYVKRKNKEAITKPAWRSLLSL